MVTVHDLMWWFVFAFMSGVSFGWAMTIVGLWLWMRDKDDKN